MHKLAGYKFASKMLCNRQGIKLVDFGCNDGIADLMYAQTCDYTEILGVDFDSEAIAWAKDNIENDKLHFCNSDFYEADINGFDVAISLDVIEHIPHDEEDIFVKMIYKSLNEKGIAIIGIPNVTLYPYANEVNKKVHINNFDQERLYNLLIKYFGNVFIFGMNDDIANTGFYPFSCYIIALCCK